MSRSVSLIPGQVWVPAQFNLRRVHACGIDAWRKPFVEFAFLPRPGSRWMTYRELAEERGITEVRTARDLARCHGWKVEPWEGRKVRVLVPNDIARFGGRPVRIHRYSFVEWIRRTEAHVLVSLETENWEN